MIPAYLVAKTSQNSHFNLAPRGGCDQYDAQFDGLFAQNDCKEFNSCYPLVPKTWDVYWDVLGFFRYLMMTRGKY